MLTVAYLKAFLAITTSVYIVEAINLLPCTEHITPEVLISTRRVLEDATPPGYTLESFHPLVRTGRNPHRWTGYFRRNDENYSCGCSYLTAVRRDFKRVCPQGSEISYCGLRNTPDNQCIEVEFLVNCYCTKVPNRRRRSARGNFYCQPQGYTTERATCTGT